MAGWRRISRTNGAILTKFGRAPATLTIRMRAQTLSTRAELPPTGDRLLRWALTLMSQGPIQVLGRAMNQTVVFDEFAKQRLGMGFQVHHQMTDPVTCMIVVHVALELVFGFRATVIRIFADYRSERAVEIRPIVGSVKGRAHEVPDHHVVEYPVPDGGHERLPRRFECHANTAPVRRVDVHHRFDPADAERKIPDVIAQHFLRL